MGEGVGERHRSSEIIENLYMKIVFKHTVNADWGNGPRATSPHPRLRQCYYYQSVENAVALLKQNHYAAKIDK